MRAERISAGLGKKISDIKLMKILVIGDSGVGKSNINLRLTQGKFDTEHNVTIGVDFGSCLIKVEESVLKL